MTLFRNILPLVLLLVAQGVGAQECVEPSRINELYQCGQTTYDPVCGCDGVTYRSQCDAYFRFGVNYWTGGVCAGIHVDYYPTPVAAGIYLQINMQLPINVFDNIQLRVIDIYSKPVYQQNFIFVNKIELPVDVSYWRTGIYFVVVTTGKGDAFVGPIAKI